MENKAPQRSSDWHNARIGLFTGSEINKLMTGGRRNMTEEELVEAKANKIKRKTVDVMFGDTAEGYIEEKASEVVFGKDLDDNLVTWDMQRGIDLEPLAFRKFKELKGLEFIEVEECSFFTEGENCGASPDGLVGKDAVLEIKCPRPKKFFKILKDGEIDEVYYDQMQMEMMVTNSKRCHFFNYIVFNGKEMWHEIIIDRDEDRIAEIRSRVDEASKLRDKYVEEFESKMQF